MKSSMTMNRMKKGASCAVGGCSKNVAKNPEVHFLKFPEDPFTRRGWLNFVNETRTDFKLILASRICSAHFEANCEVESVRLKRQFGLTTQFRLKPGSVPTLKEPSSNSAKPATATDTVPGGSASYRHDRSYWEPPAGGRSNKSNEDPNLPFKRRRSGGAFQKREHARVLLEAFQAYDAKYCGGSGSGAVSVHDEQKSTTGKDKDGGKVRDGKLPTKTASSSETAPDGGKVRDDELTTKTTSSSQTTSVGGNVRDDKLPTKTASSSQTAPDDSKVRDENQQTKTADSSGTTSDGCKVRNIDLPAMIADYATVIIIFKDGKVRHRNGSNEIAVSSAMPKDDSNIPDDNALSEISDTSAMTTEDGMVRDENVSTKINDSSPLTTEDCIEVQEQINNGVEDGVHLYEGLQSFIPNEFSRWENLRDQMLPHSDLLKYTRRVVEDEFTSWSDDEAFTSYLLDCLELDLAHGSEINQEGDEDEEVHTELHRIFPHEAGRWETLRDRMKKLPYFDRYVNNPDRPKWRTDELFTSCLLDRLEEQLENLQQAKKREEWSEQYHQEEEEEEEEEDVIVIEDEEEEEDVVILEEEESEEEEEEEEDEEEPYDDPNDSDYVPEYIERRPRRRRGLTLLPKKTNESSSDSWDSDEMEEDTDKMPKQKVHQCNICKEHLPTKVHVIEHYSTQHKEVHNNKTPSKKTTSLPPTMKAEDFSTVLWFCKQCESYVADLKQHRRENHQVCQVCGFVSASHTLLLQHMEQHTKTEEERRNLLCDYCGKRYVTRNAFKMHLKVHRGEKLRKHKCDICNKVFIMRQALKQHKLIHSNEQNFECNVCGRRFTQKYNMFKHTRIHTGIKPYSCDLCDESFNHNISLKNHKKKKHGIDWWSKNSLAVTTLPKSPRRKSAKKESLPKLSQQKSAKKDPLPKSTRRKSAKKDHLPKSPHRKSAKKGPLPKSPLRLSARKRKQLKGIDP